ncbi:MAG: hypothetical protein ACI91Z_001834 [Yoonia sp.]
MPAQGHGLIAGKILPNFKPAPPIARLTIGP